MNLTTAIKYRNVRAFLWGLRYGEGTQAEDGYRMLFGGGRFVGADGVADTFDDFADHPRILVTRTVRGKKLSSTAAGAYQYLSRTWDEVAKANGFQDFSPVNQDLGAIWLIARRKALEDVIAGRIEDAVRKCNREWASLPGSPYGQPVVTMAVFLREYAEAGGLLVAEDSAVAPLPPPPPAPDPKLPEPPVLAPVEDRVPVPVEVIREKYPEAPVPSPSIGESIMAIPAAIIAAVLPSLIQLVPQLGKIFGSGSEVQQRNVTAATTVLEIAKEAIGARNEQELLEQIQNDPANRDIVRKAIVENWFRIEEIGSGGIQGAREYALKAATLVDAKGNNVPAWKQPSFLISIALLIPVWFVVAVVLWPFLENPFSDEIRLVVVTAVISGALSAVSGFWLGASFSNGSRRTTDVAPTQG